MRLFWIVAGVMVLDQATKLIVRLNMDMGHLGAIDLVGSWLKFTYTENPGMAFGITFGPAGLITIFSLLAAAMITVYMHRVRTGYLPYTVSLACILGGALGNIIDRLFYGMVFDYAPFFQGRVVDFIHFDIWQGQLPSFLPLIGDVNLALFPIFNVADIGIVGGVIGILVFQKKFLAGVTAEQSPEEPVNPESLGSPIQDSHPVPD